MAKLSVFNLITLDGYFKGPKDDISWHNVDAEFQKYAEKASNSGNILVFGHRTYKMMKSYWTSNEALKNDPVVAAGMNKSSKIVFSRKLKKADWENARLVKTSMVAEIRKLKSGRGKNMTILGSGSLVAQLAQKNLIDEYQILLNPLALGKGKSMFEGMSKKLSLNLSDYHVFKNSNVLLVYKAKKR